MSAGTRIAVTASALLGLLGCSREGDTGPPVVHYGQDVCAACNMIVSEERFAAAVVAEDGGRMQPRVFDDVGCLFAWERSHAEQPVVTRWVHDHAGGGWIAAGEAWYVRSPDIRSPMGSGVASFATREQAETVAERDDGELLDWTGLQERGRGTGLLAPPPRGTGS